MSQIPVAHSGRILSVNISKEKGTVKEPVEAVRMAELGIEGDAHAGRWDRQVSLLAREEVERFEHKAGRPVRNGEFAENITTTGMDLTRVALLDRFRIGTVELEVTQIGKKCHGAACAIFREVGECVMPKEGLFARVVSGGEVRAGDEILHMERPFRIRVITLSDRASAGEYPDLSGPKIQEMLAAFFEGKRWHVEVDRRLIPDNAAQLEQMLGEARSGGIDAVFTTGGTGIGPRDITPDVVAMLADRQIPGIMDHIRLKYGATNPNALMSRSVAAVMGSTLVFALPGSVKAVSEYMEEILKVFEHAFRMLHGLGH
ncbi:MAG: MOSC domain-containing protein [Deltaproteobacteria bacterium]|nr:MOSC domain-containing protein [Deltaproteobacteria bacterium]